MRLTNIIPLIENENTYRFSNDLVDSYSGQHNFELGVFDRKTDNILGLLEYTEYKGIPSISMIQVIPDRRRKGIGTALLLKLQELYPGKKIELGYITPDGKKLLDKVKGKLK